LASFTKSLDLAFPLFSTLTSFDSFATKTNNNS